MISFSLVALACSGGEIQKPTEETGWALGALAVASVEPAQGSAAGGTDLRIGGEGFTWDTTSVSIDGAACTDLAFLSAELLACTTPAGSPGDAELRVTRLDDGATTTAVFTYVDEGGDTDGGDTDGGTSDSTDSGSTDDGGGDGGDTDTGAGGSGGSGDGGSGDGGSDDTGRDDTGPGASADYCHLQWPCSQTAAADSASETVYCWVYQAGVTDAAGEGAGLTVELGYGADGSNPEGGWSWARIRYLEDVVIDEATPNDLYEGSFTTPRKPGDYDYACRVSADGGDWLYCDAGDDGAGDGCGDGLLGSSDGYTATHAGQLTVE